MCPVRPVPEGSVASARRSLRSGSLTYSSARRALRALSQRNSAEACVRFLRDAASVVDVNEHLCSFALDACARHGNMELAHEVFRELVHTPSAVTFCILVKGYGRRADELKEWQSTERSDCMASIEGLVVDMKRRGVQADTVFANALIDAYVRCGRVDRALETLRTMLRDKHRPNERGFNAVLKGLARAGNVRSAVALVRQMARLGVPTTAVTSATLVHALAAGGKPGLAERLLVRRGSAYAVEAPEAATAAFTAVVKAHARHADAVRAFRLVKSMRTLGVPRNQVTYAELLVAASGDHRLVDTAWRLMKADGIRPSSVTYNAAIAAYVARGANNAAPAFRRAFALANHARAQNLMTPTTLNTLLDALLREAERDAQLETVALDLFDRARRGARSLPHATAATFSIVIRYFARVSRDTERVKGAWQAALEAQSVDVVTANTYLDALIRCDEIREALSLLEEMATTQTPCPPDLVSYATLVDALSRSTNAFAGDKALQLYEQASRDFQPDAGLVKAALLACLSLRGRKFQSIVLAHTTQDPALAAARKILANLNHLPATELAALKTFAASTLLGTTNEAWKVNENSSPARRPADTFINNKNWNSFNSGFRLL